MLHSFNKLTHTILLISNVSTILVCPNIYIYLLLQVAVNLWESEIGITGFIYIYIYIFFFYGGGGGIFG